MPDQIQNVFEVSRVLLLVFDLEWLGALSIFEVARDDFFHGEVGEIVFRGLSILEDHFIHVHDTVSCLEGWREEHGSLLA